MWVGECGKCGARLANWMSGNHNCMPPEPDYHPYRHWLDPLELDDE